LYKASWTLMSVYEDGFSYQDMKKQKIM